MLAGGGRSCAQKNKYNNSKKTVLRLPDLDHAKSSVLNSLSSPNSRRNYKFAMEQFIVWYCSEPRQQRGNKNRATLAVARKLFS
jgi:hypothetical protein